LSRQAVEKGLDEIGKIIVIGGKNYTHKISELFCDKDISAPLEGCKGMGYMKGKLNDALINKSRI
jgi:hypothetical protein